MITGVTSTDPCKALRGPSRKASFGLAILTLSVATAVGMSACADPEATFYVATPVQATATCDKATGLTIKCGSEFQAAATVFTCLDCNGNLIQNAYACFEIRSELAPSNLNSNQIEKRTIVLESVDATMDIGGSTVKGHFPTSGAIEPSPNGAPVAIQAGVPLVSADNLQSFYAAGVSKKSTIVVYGRTTGGLELQTPPYTFATTVNELKMTCM